MTQAVRQRAGTTHARSNTCCLLAAAWILLAAAPLAAQAPPEPPAERDPEATTAITTRGVPTPAASLAATVPRPQDTGAAQAQLLPAPQDTPGPEAATVSPTPVQRGVLFRITPPAPTLLPAEAAENTTAAAAPGAESLPPPRPSYLLATIHFGTPEEQGIDYATLEGTLAQVETFVNEADLDAAWKQDYDGYRWLAPDTPLSTLVGQERFAMARALLPNVRPQDLERMKPWSVLALLEARGEPGGEATMDARLQRMAAAAGKRMLHLETLEEQLQALDCVPAGEHVRVLDERLGASWILRIESAQAMAWYRARNLDAWLADIDRMEGLGEQARAIEQRARRCLLEDRNARWIGQLQTLFQDGPCLVAVGAVHLPGAEGLLAALRRDGFAVEAVPL